MLSLLSYWQPIAAAFAAFALSFLIHTVDVNRIEAKHTREMAAQVAKLQAECLAEKNITKTVEDTYEKRITALNDKLNAIRMQPAHCIPVFLAQPAVGTHAAARPAGHARQNGVTSAALLNFAGECEGYRLKLISLQDFITQTWKAKHQ